MECDEIITNPVCADCLAPRMRLFVEGHDPAMAALVQGFASSSLFNDDGSNDEESTYCIFCRKSISLCAHCFSKEVHDMIQEQNQSLAAEFASLFDFNLRGEVAAFA